MAKSRSEKKGQATASEPKILPMELRVGDRLTDETGEWEVIGQPYTTAGGGSFTHASRGSANPEVGRYEIGTLPAASARSAVAEEGKP
jgi:hypothetical protein